MEILFYILIFFTGASLGSFINVVVDRLPKDRSIISPPSHCEACGKRLSPADLVPVFSFLLLRGRCRHCGARVPWRLFAVELGCGLGLVLLLAFLGPTTTFIFASFWLLFFTLMALIDLENGLVLNVLVYGGAVLAFILIPFYPGLKLGTSLLGAGVGLAALLAPALLWRGGMGWGDVKLAFLYGLLTGWPGSAVFILVSFVSGGLAAAGLMASGRGRKAEIPFVPFLSAGAGVALLWGERLWEWYTGLF